MLLRPEEVKKLYDINQICKNIFTEYTIEKGVIYTPDDSYNINKGEHYGILNNNIFVDLYNRGMLINAQDFFESLKKIKKKEIGGIEIIGKNVYFDDLRRGLVRIGTTGNDLSLPLKTTKLFKEIRNSNIKYTLNEEELERVLNNELLILKFDNVTLRITKEILPKISNKYKVDIRVRMYPNNFMKTMFIMEKEKSLVVTYHIYTCVNF